MLFSVKNFGAIREATVDLSHDCIILAGQNNTGKTYLAYLIYALYNEIAQEKTRWTNLSEKAPLPLKNFVEKELKKTYIVILQLKNNLLNKQSLNGKQNQTLKDSNPLGSKKSISFLRFEKGFKFLGKNYRSLKTKRLIYYYPAMRMPVLNTVLY
jgi:recombinational DNA repair ATPase RecF